MANMITKTADEKILPNKLVNKKNCFKIQRNLSDAKRIPERKNNLQVESSLYGVLYTKTNMFPSHLLSLQPFQLFSIADIFS